MVAVELRKTLEVLCDECGISKKDEQQKRRSIGDRLNELGKQRMLPPQVSKLAHKIVKSGNDAAHPTGVDRRIAPLLKGFFKVFVNHVYVIPMQEAEWETYQTKS